MTSRSPRRPGSLSEGTIVAHVVEVVDGYLLAAIMLIFALGLYELFVSRIEIAEGSEFAERLLLIRSLDDLKDRLAKVVLLILVVKFFGMRSRSTSTGPWTCSGSPWALPWCPPPSCSARVRAPHSRHQSALAQQRPPPQPS